MECDLYLRALEINRLADSVAPYDTEHLLSYAWSLVHVCEGTKRIALYPELATVLSRLQEADLDQFEQSQYGVLLDRINQPWYREKLPQS